MKINKLFFGLIAVAGLLFTACHENSDDDYKWATASGEQVFFDFSLPSRIDLEKSATQYVIPVKRLNTSGAITVPVKTTATGSDLLSKLQVPSSVSFNAGEAETALTVGYDPEKFDYDDFKDMEISLGEEAITPYGKSIYKFSIGIPSPLEFLGKAHFAENYWFGEDYDVELYQNTENRNEFRIKDPFGKIANDYGLDGNQSEWLAFTVLQPGDVIGDLTITMNDLVYFSVINTGDYASNYSTDVFMYHPADMASKLTEAGMSYSRVLSYQENGLPGQVQLDPAYLLPDGRGWNGWGDNGQVIITFPNYIPLDMQADAHYQGIFTDTDDAYYAVAELELTKDATDVRAVVVPADADPEAVADAVASGDLEAITVTSGRIEVPIGEDMTGKLQIVIVMLYEGKVMNTAVVPFEFYGGGKNPWVSLGKGLYTDDFVVSAFGMDPVTYEVEIQENSENPGLYRMVNPYISLPGVGEADLVDPNQTFNIEIDATNPNAVIIYEQPIGLDFGYGPMSIVSYGGYMLTAYDFETLNSYGYFGIVQDGTILLPTFRRLDDARQPLYDDNGNPLIYQGLLFDDDGGYYACVNGAFKVVLPEAVSAQAKAQAKKMAKANEFVGRLIRSGVKVDKRAARRELNRKMRVSQIIKK